MGWDTGIRIWDGLWIRDGFGIWAWDGYDGLDIDMGWIRRWDRFGMRYGFEMDLGWLWDGSGDMDIERFGMELGWDMDRG